MRIPRALLFFFLMAFGGTVELAFRARTMEFGEIGPLFEGTSRSFEAEQRIVLPKDTRVELQNAHGDVTVRPGPPGEARVTLKKTIWTRREERAKQVADEVTIRAEISGGRLFISTTRDEVSHLYDARLQTDFEVELPPATPLKVTNEHGATQVAGMGNTELDGSHDDLKAEDIQGSLHLRSAHGDVSVSRVDGPVDLESYSGDVSVHGAKGPVTLKVAHGDVDLDEVGGATVSLAHGDLKTSGVRGDLRVSGEHAAVNVTGVTGGCVVETSFKGVEIKDVGGDVRVKTEHGSMTGEDLRGSVGVDVTYDSVTLTRVQGPVEARVVHGGVQVEGLASGVKLVSSGEDVAIKDFKGPVDVNVTRGGVELVPSSPLSTPVSVITANGSISMSVPSGSRFDLEASAEPGDLSVADLTGFVPTVKTNSKASGRVAGGGSPVVLKAQHGDVSLSASSEKD